MASKKTQEQPAEAAEATPAVPTASIAAHPRASVSIRRSRTRAGLGAFGLILVLNLLGHHDPFDAVWRALIAGIVVNLVVWRCAIVVWRHVITTELRLAEEQYAERRRAAIERLQQQAAGERNDSVGFRAA